MFVNTNLNIYQPINRWRQWHSTPVLLPGKSHGWRSLVGCSPWGHEESDMTEWLHFHFSLSCVGEGNGNPLQCSHLENPRDGRAWWASVYGVAQSRAWLKRLSSSSSSSLLIVCEVCACSFSPVQFLETLWTVAIQTPLCMGFSRQEYWSGLPCPPSGYLSDPGINPTSLAFLALQVYSSLLSHQESP